MSDLINAFVSHLEGPLTNVLDGRGFDPRQKHILFVFKVVLTQNYVILTLIRYTLFSIVHFVNVPSNLGLFPRQLLNLYLHTVAKISQG